MTRAAEARAAEAAAMFVELVERSEAERDGCVSALAGSDPELARLVRELLDADAAAGSFLEEGAAAYAPRLGGASDSGTESLAGKTIGPYALVSPLGRGGMGEVWVAERRDGQFQQRVALKLLKRGIDSEGIRRRFLQERQVLARLDHPHIARLLDGGESEGRPYFVMELVEGEPITEHCRQRRLSLEERLRLLVTCCEAVDAAHRNLVVHRDIKPSNILVTADGQAKLLDFGIAKVLADDGDATRFTQAEERVLTPSYAAPEQILGEPVTTATDVYALGVVLYQLLTGMLPHVRDAASAARLASAVEHETIERPSRVAGRGGAEGAGLPPKQAEKLGALLEDDLDAIVLKALRREPERRYPGAAELGRDLTRQLSGQRVEARPDTFSYRARKFVRRHRGGVAAAILVLLALVAGLAGTAWQARRARANARRAERVQEFLIQLFKASDPNQSRGAALTAKELLADGARRIDRELAGEPEVQATLHDAVSQIYRSLGALPEARALAERAVAERRTALGPDDPITAQSRVTLAEALFAAGDAKEAEKELRAALPVLTAAYGPDGAETIRAKETLASVLVDRGEGKESLDLAQGAVAALRRRFGEENVETARGLLLLGNVEETGDHYAEAERTYRAALAALEKTLGAESPQAAAARYSLAQVLAYVGKRDEGEKQFQLALAAQRKTLGDRHPDVAQTLIAVGLLYVNQRRYPEADAAFTEALAIYRPIDHPEVATCLRMLGLSSASQERYAEAASRFEEALAIFRRTRGDRDTLTLTALGNLGNAYMRLGDFGKAEPALREAISGIEAQFGPDNDQLRAPLNQLGELERARGRADEAAVLHRRALAIQLKSVGAESPSVAGTRYQLALDLLAKKDAASLAEARGLLDAAIAAQRKADADHPRLDDMLLASGRVAAASGETARARQDLGEAASRYERHRGAADPRTAEARRDLVAAR
ncbi:MAG TPA: tetratricopeptide repeat protein [Thermoanaerobaculia bacterium]|nr:tetratricopeptide repeat protein [Thermoanaerobaculia bacterium]